jgi:hypothetical protein
MSSELNGMLAEWYDHPVNVLRVQLQDSVKDLNEEITARHRRGIASGGYAFRGVSLDLPPDAGFSIEDAPNVVRDIQERAVADFYDKQQAMFLASEQGSFPHYSQEMGQERVVFWKTRSRDDREVCIYERRSVGSPNKFGTGFRIDVAMAYSDLEIDAYDAFGVPRPTEKLAEPGSTEEPTPESQLKAGRFKRFLARRRGAMQGIIDATSNPNLRTKGRLR